MTDPVLIIEDSLPTPLHQSDNGNAKTNNIGDSSIKSILLSSSSLSPPSSGNRRRRTSITLDLASEESKTCLLDELDERPSLQSVTSFRSTSTLPWHDVEANKARIYVKDLFADSMLDDGTSTLPKFTQDECTLGKYLGKGTFGTVHEIREFSIQEAATITTGGGVVLSTNKKKKHSNHQPTAVLQEVENGMEGRTFIAQHCIRATGEARYAMKCLNSNIIDDRTQYLQGVTNMVIEARMLSAVSHPNIIKLRALAAGDQYQQPGFFLIMDRLYDTLDKRLTKWQRRRLRGSSLFGVLDRKGKKKAELLEERLVAAFDLSAALEYLHMSRILHRDIKPENIGFDIRGDIKLFDFSSATEIHPALANQDGTYNLTGMTGSLSYMAPEVVLGEPYNESCNVYSFAILFWEMYALKKPFGSITCNAFWEVVVQGNKRPPISDAYSSTIQLLLKQCWCKNIATRLSMKDVALMLKKEILVLRGADSCQDLEHARRRSTFVNQNASSPLVPLHPTKRYISV